MAFAIWRRWLHGGPAAHPPACPPPGPLCRASTFPAPAPARCCWLSVRCQLCLSPAWSCHGADELDVEVARLTLVLAGGPQPCLHPHGSGVMGGCLSLPFSAPLLCRGSLGVGTRFGPACTSKRRGLLHAPRHFSVASVLQDPSLAGAGRLPGEAVLLHARPPLNSPCPMPAGC